ncbi:MAG: cation-translocating P-type ATPase [Candidatus Bathyarchaeota archaeon]|nr:cation-translocating P-type ATPase [Candidatus Bathyarchaeota archaeon]
MGQVWHSLDVDEAVRELSSSKSGLTTKDAQGRLAKFGPNELRKEKGRSVLSILLHQFKDVLLIILLVATALSLVMGEFIDALIILVIVVVSVLLGFRQEYRSGKALEALKKMTAPMAVVLRDGREQRIPARDLVPGDVILLYTGDRVPADARLIEAINLKVEEAALTGESAPVDKSTQALPEETQLNDRRNLLFTGTILVYGRAKAVVTDTAMKTEFGKIAQMVQTTTQESTPLEKRMAGVGKWIGILVIGIAVVVGAIGILQGRNILDMVQWAISLAVAAVPVALPAIVTASLSVGMYRMAKVHTIVKRLPAVETLGSTSVICSDKTGTMTKGEMTVQRIYVNDRALKVSGIGYAPKGSFLCEEKTVEPDEELKLLLKIAALCNDSNVELDAKVDKWVIKGDPTEGALVVAAAKADMSKEALDKREPRIAEIPFSSERKRMTTIHEVGNKKYAYMKGAPEIILEKCNRILLNGKAVGFEAKEKAEVHKVSEVMALQALRNLGFAYKELPENQKAFEENMETDFVFVGIMGMIDPPRDEVKDAINICRRAGIRVVMITGDHKLTAVAVGKELNLLGENQIEEKVLTGADLDKISDSDLIEIIDDIVIYARVAPEHKTRIVNAWKVKNQIVAMTGDGVNDAPALKMADIGVAMGVTGTEVTKEASDMVLADDNFASIVKAVKEGREIYGNIKKYLTYLLRCNIMEIIVVLTAVISVPLIAQILTPNSEVALIGEAAIALTTIQLLWINLTTDGLPAIALSVDPGDPDLMDQKPRNPKESIFTRDVKIYLTAVPILMATILLGSYLLYRPWESIQQLVEARTQLFTTLILMELANALSARSLKYPVFKVGVFKNKLLWYALISSLLLQVAILYIPGLQNAFDITVPTLQIWAVAWASTAFVFGMVELGKYVASKRRGDK